MGALKKLKLSINGKHLPLLERLKFVLQVNSTLYFYSHGYLVIYNIKAPNGPF